MLPAVLSQLGLPFVLSILGRALGEMDSPVAKTAAQALNNFDRAVTGGQIGPDQLAEANRHAEEMARIEVQGRSAGLSEINQSLRAEVSSDDLYVRRMRPTFGYLMALTWAAQMFGIAYVIVFKTAEAGLVLRAADSLTVIWTVGLSVLGIYVYKRSEEKKAAPDSSAPPSAQPSRPLLRGGD